VSLENGLDGPARPTVAAFDFDGTITRGGSTLPFLIRARGLLPVLWAVGRTLPLIVKAGIFSGTAADEAKERLFILLLADYPLERIERAGAAFAEQHLRRRLRPDVRARLDWHQQQGHRVVVVSASLEHYVEPAGRRLGVDGVLATRLAVGGAGLLTGRFDGKNCRGAEKYARVVGWMRMQGMAGAGPAQPVLWAYGNSRGDTWLLNSADHGVDAGRLGRFGRLSHFPTLAAVVAGGPGAGRPAGRGLPS
jgi:phosphatidylglycerophosphatase C